MKASILAVDDSQRIRRLLRAVLERAGHQVTDAATGEVGLAILEGSPAPRLDLIITDLYMPDLDGLSLIRRIRRLEGYRSIPILVLTAECSDVMRRRGRVAGATRWLLKPFDPGHLCRAVTGALTGSPPGAP